MKAGGRPIGNAVRWSAHGLVRYVGGWVRWWTERFMGGLVDG